MKKLLLIIIPLFILLAGITNAVIKKGGHMLYTNKTILIAYFSWGGNTKSIAEKIHAKTNADIFQIETKQPYPTDYNETAYGIAKEQHDKNIHPELKNNIDINKYDIIFVGTPVWWYTMAPAVMTFLEINNFEGKTIIPFITHGGGGKYQIAEEISKLAKGSKVLTPFVVYENGNAQTDKELNNWLSKTLTK